MQRVVIVDYGSGNLHSARKAVERAAREAELAVDVSVSADAGAVATADRVILPGVGAFADCAAGLAAVPGMIDALNAFAIERGVDPAHRRLRALVRCEGRHGERSIRKKRPGPYPPTA